MTTPVNRRIVLAARPAGRPVPEDFRLETVPVPTPGAGQVLLRTLSLSLDPYMRNLMEEVGPGYAPPVGLGEVLVGGTVSRVVESRHPDWRAGELLVRGKGQRHDRLPIPSDVGEAIAAYIRQERVSASRTLFVSLWAPHGPFKGGQIVNAILKDAFAATGVTPPGPYVGSHVLRHSLATNMIRSGASLAEIGDMLRHRSRASTMIYAKLDIDGLRTIARPWPVAGEVQ